MSAHDAHIPYTKFTALAKALPCRISRGTQYFQDHFQLNTVGWTERLPATERPLISYSLSRNDSWAFLQKSHENPFPACSDSKFTYPRMFHRWKSGQPSPEPLLACLRGWRYCSDVEWMLLRANLLQIVPLALASRSLCFHLHALNRSVWGQDQGNCHACMRVHTYTHVSNYCKMLWESIQSWWNSIA